MLALCLRSARILRPRPKWSPAFAELCFNAGPVRVHATCVCALALLVFLGNSCARRAARGARSRMRARVRLRLSLRRSRTQRSHTARLTWLMLARPRVRAPSRLPARPPARPRPPVRVCPPCACLPASPPPRLPPRARRLLRWWDSALYPESLPRDWVDSRRDRKSLVEEALLSRL
jgi:hypothetical protein